MAGKPWSHAELSTLRRLYPSAPRAELYAALPGRTKHGIKMQAFIQGYQRHAVLHQYLQRPQTSRYANIKFELDQIREIKDFARKHTLSMAAAIQLLCEWGLEAERNYNEDMPKTPRQTKGRDGTRGVQSPSGT